MIIASIIFAVLAVWFFWPGPKCPRCGNRNSIPTTFPAKIPGYRDCLSCHEKWDSWTQP